MNPHLASLQSYPFEKLSALCQGIQPSSAYSPLRLSIGEPQYPAPDIIHDCLFAHREKFSLYPNTRGLPELRHAIAAWLENRFQLGAGAVDPDHQVLTLNGTREGLFSCAQTFINASAQELVLVPNPFYQIYEGAAWLAGAQPWYLPCYAEQGFLPDFDQVPAAVWQRCAILYLCSPANPTGAVLTLAQLQQVIELAHRYDFIIAADECYSEIYWDEHQPPAGLLQAAMAMGVDDFNHCLVFHSLSKRSNVPGLRSGFVAGAAHLIKQFFNYRTYHGCAMPIPHQYASLHAWRDEEHVIANRARYRQTLTSALAYLKQIDDYSPPAGGFYLWLPTPIDELIFTQELFKHYNMLVLPGRFLSRPQKDGRDPGQGFVRIALVYTEETCLEAMTRLCQYRQSLTS
jgi:N-succinyldiaminopimelate aminotransferase